MDQIAALSKRGEDAVRALRPGTGLEHFDADAALLHVLLTRLEQQDEELRSQYKVLSPTGSSSFEAAAGGGGSDSKVTNNNSNNNNNSNLIRLMQSQGVTDNSYYNTPSLGASPPRDFNNNNNNGNNNNNMPLDIRKQVGRLRSEYEIGRATLQRMIKAVTELLTKYHSTTGQNKELEKQLQELQTSHFETSKELRTLKLTQKHLSTRMMRKSTSEGENCDDEDVDVDSEPDQSRDHRHRNHRHRNSKKSSSAKNDEVKEAWKLESEASSKEVEDHVRSSVEHFKTLVLLHRHSKNIASIVCPPDVEDMKNSIDNNSNSDTQSPPSKPGSFQHSVFSGSSESAGTTMTNSNPNNLHSTTNVISPSEDNNNDDDQTKTSSYIDSLPNFRSVLEESEEERNARKLQEAEDRLNLHLERHPNIRRQTRRELLAAIRSIDERNEFARSENESRTGTNQNIAQPPPQRKKISDVLKAVDNFLTEWGSNNNNVDGNEGGDCDYYNNDNTVLFSAGDMTNNNNNTLGKSAASRMMMSSIMGTSGIGGRSVLAASTAHLFRTANGAVIEYDEENPYNYNPSERFAIAACRSEMHMMQVDDFEERIEGITILRRTQPHPQPHIMNNEIVDVVTGRKSRADEEKKVQAEKKQQQQQQQQHSSTALVKQATKNTTKESAGSTGGAQDNDGEANSNNNNNMTMNTEVYVPSTAFRILPKSLSTHLTEDEKEEYDSQLKEIKDMTTAAARGEMLRTFVKCRPQDRRVISLATMLVEALCQNKSPFLIIRSAVPDETVLSRETMRSHGLGPVWQAGGDATFCIVSCPLPLVLSSSSSSSPGKEKTHTTTTTTTVVTSTSAPSSPLVRKGESSMSINSNNSSSATNGNPSSPSLSGAQQQQLLLSTLQIPPTSDPFEAAQTPGLISLLSAFCVPQEITSKYETSAAKAEAARRYLLKENYLRCYASSALPGTVTAALIGPFVDSSRPFFITANESGGEYVEIFFNRAVVYPTGYSFACCHVSGAASFPRSWRLEGSTDSGVTWTLLKRHVNDRTLHHACPRAAWTIDPPVMTTTTDASEHTGGGGGGGENKKKTNSNSNNTTSSDKPPTFSRFRISIEGPNSSGSWHINASCIEIYGRMLTLHSSSTPSLIAQEHVPFLGTTAESQPALRPQQQQQQQQQINSSSSAISGADQHNTSSNDASSSFSIMNATNNNSSNHNQLLKSSSMVTSYSGLGAPPAVVVPKEGKKEKTTKTGTGKNAKKSSPSRRR